MSAGSTLASFRQQRLVDEAVVAYVEWREESGAVWVAYGRWASAPAEDAGHAHAAYRAALDREEAAAQVYANLIESVGELLRPGMTTPVDEELPPHVSRSAFLGGTAEGA
jgi:hypothetical protein